MPAQWNAITAREITEAVQGDLLSGEAGTTFTGLSTDSRTISRGQLFWPLKGEKFEGHDYIHAALQRGAAGIVADRKHAAGIFFSAGIPVIIVENTLLALGDFASWWRRQYTLRVAVITGSTGKTTTKEMTGEILSLGEPTLKNEGNLNNLIGLPLTLFRLNSSHRRAVLEMGMNRPGEIGRLTEIAAPSLGLITNVAMAHLEGFGGIDGVARAKVELIEKISPENPVILNGDDDLLMKTASLLQRKIMTFGLGPDNDFRGVNIEKHGMDGAAFTLLHRGKKIKVRLRVPGSQNIINALAASAIALVMEVPPDQIVEGIYGYQGIKGRFNPVSLGEGIILVDDTYNANPYSLKAALAAVKDLKGKKSRAIICLGQMAELGEMTVTAHKEAGALIASMGADYLLVMGENAAEVIEGALQTGFDPARVKAAVTHREVARMIKEIMKPGDLILVKGSRVMEMEKVSRLLMGQETGGA